MRRPVRDGRRLQARAGRVRGAPGATRGELAQDLDLVALATIADVVRCCGENRTLVRRGLRALAATRKPGLRALMARGARPAGQRRRAGGRLRAGAAHQRRRAPVPRRRRPGAAAHRGPAARGADRRRAGSRKRRAQAGRDAHSLRGRSAARRAWRARRLRARWRGLARGRDRHRRVAPGRAPQPSGRDDRAGGRKGSRVGAQHRLVRSARRPGRVQRAPARPRRPSRGRRSGDRCCMRAGVRHSNGCLRKQHARAGGPAGGRARRRGRRRRRAGHAAGRGAALARAVRPRQPELCR